MSREVRLINEIEWILKLVKAARNDLFERRLVKTDDLLSAIQWRLEALKDELQLEIDEFERYHRK